MMHGTVFRIRAELLRWWKRRVRLGATRKSRFCSLRMTILSLRKRTTISFRALSAYASWGYFDPGDAAGGRSEFGDYQDGYQNVPVNWGINTDRKRGFFGLLGAITGEG